MSLTFYVKQSKIPCLWEKKEVGCKNIRCAYFHTKARYINGVFLRPSIVSDITSEKSKSLDSFRLPIYPPVIINLMDEEDDDDSEEEEDPNDYKAEQRQLSPEEEEEVKAIMAVCYGAGDIYKVPICDKSTFKKSTPDGGDSNINRALDAEHQKDKKRSHKGHNKTSVPGQLYPTVQMYTEPYQKPGRRRPQNWANKNNQPDATMEKNTGQYQTGRIVSRNWVNKTYRKQDYTADKNTDQYQPGTRSPWINKNESWSKNTGIYSYTYNNLI
ncbi:uncharacterized protein C12orf50 homolog [Mixophyes fleayi]|uniref:uncharacterized protein C12orf50 homolog n=1 Tax=Mixophyes fleayi TaxID=3061075 RepID=UPI003F4DE33F